MTPVRVLGALLVAVGVLIVAELAAGALDFRGDPYRRRVHDRGELRGRRH